MILKGLYESQFITTWLVLILAIALTSLMLDRIKSFL